MENTDKPKRKNNRNRNRNRNRNKSNVKAGSTENSSQAKPKSNNNKRRNNNRRNNKKPGGKATLTGKYIKIWEDYQLARRKYFALFDRAQDSQRIKLEKKFQQTLKAFRDFEDNLTDKDRQIIKEFSEKKDDNTYSQNHELDPKAEPVNFIGDFNNPHLMQSQTEEDFSSDTEESSGSLEDYENYKGL